MAQLFDSIIRDRSLRVRDRLARTVGQERHLRRLQVKADEESAAGRQYWLKHSRMRSNVDGNTLPIHPVRRQPSAVSAALTAPHQGLTMPSVAAR